jgi:type II secretory pathway component GspD/PulD (secretin)
VAQFTIEIADQDVNRVLNAIAKNYNRPDTVIDDNGNEVDNPETVAQFANRMVRKFLLENVQAYEVKEAKRSAAEQAKSSANPDIRDPELP